MLFQELSSELGLESRDNLSRIDDESKENATHRCIDTINKMPGNVIVNGHLVRMGSPNLHHGVSHVERLQPTVITCITADPEIIVLRSSSDSTRKRTEFNINMIRDTQDLQISLVASLAKQMGISYRFIDNSTSQDQAPAETLSEIVAEEINRS